MTANRRPQRPALPPRRAGRSPSRASAPVRSSASRRWAASCRRSPRKAFEKYGFSTATPDHRLAGHRRPRACRLHRAGAPEMAARAPSSTDADEARRRPARAAPAPRWCCGSTAARALDVQYNARQIIERINAYFGYAAIAELRIVQAPVGLPAAACAPGHRASAAAADARGRRHRRSGPARRAGPARRRASRARASVPIAKFVSPHAPNPIGGPLDVTPALSRQFALFAREPMLSASH